MLILVLLIRHMFKPLFAVMALLLSSLCFAENINEELPLWELGVGIGGSSLPQYMGSDERYAIPFVFPYIIYRGDNWRVDPSGVKNRIFEANAYTLDLSLSGGLPVRNDNKARENMPELLFTGEIGAKLNWYLKESEDESWIVRLPLRAVVDIEGKYAGLVADPVLTRRHYYHVEHGLLKTY
ncbi:MAG: MipA/OmpV family protein, partial [Ghiorsea sp.]|nr:MipA/OmpV family protein [Ghiorsea sp.]